MMKSGRIILFFIPLLIFLVAVLFLLVALFKGREDSSLPPVGETVPSFVLENFSTDTITRSDGGDGKVKLVNFFASWCVPCRYEHTFLEVLSQKEGLVLFGIAWKDDAQATKKFIDELGNPFAAIGQDNKGVAGFEWGISGIPESYIIDKRNIVRYRHRGVLTPELVDNVLFPLIDELQKEGGG